MFESLCQTIEANFLDEEGVFRLAGSKNTTNSLKVQIDQGTLDISTLKEPHTTVDLLKVWLREMPEPLLTHNLYNRIMDVRSTCVPHVVSWLSPLLTLHCTAKDTAERADYLRSVLEYLPAPNRAVLKRLMELLSKCVYLFLSFCRVTTNAVKLRATEHTKQNKMSPVTLSTCIAPNILMCAPL